MRTIVLLTQYFKPEMGAPQTRLWETAKGLQQKGWNILVITSMPNYPSGKIEAAYKSKWSMTETIDGIAIKRYWLYASNSKKIMPRIVNMLSFAFMVLGSVMHLYKTKPEYIITESPPLALGLSGVILSKLTGVKHILNVSDLWPLSAFELGAIRKGKLYSALQYFEHWLYRNSFACTGQSLEITQTVEQHGAKQVLLYRNGVTASRFTPTPLIPLPGEPIKIVYTGLLGVAQGILDICQNISFASYRCKFHIYGDGAERTAIEQYLANNPHCRIFYYGKVAASDIPIMLSKYHLTLIPLVKHIYGAVPSKIYESMAAGLPILFAGGGEGALLVKQCQTGWICEPSDYENMKRILLQLSFITSEEWKKLKSNCMEAGRIFDRSTQIDNLDHFLEKNACISHL